MSAAVSFAPADPARDVDTLAKALGPDPREILSQPTPRPAYTGAVHLLVRVVGPETVDKDKANPAAKELLDVLKVDRQKVAISIHSIRIGRKQPTHGASTLLSDSGKTRPPEGSGPAGSVSRRRGFGYEQPVGDRTRHKDGAPEHPANSSQSKQELSGTGIVVLRWRTSCEQLCGHCRTRRSRLSRISMRASSPSHSLDMKAGLRAYHGPLGTQAILSGFLFAHRFVHTAASMEDNRAHAVPSILSLGLLLK